jgi:hypothetical protein
MHIVKREPWMIRKDRVGRHAGTELVQSQRVGPNTQRGQAMHAE